LLARSLGARADLAEATDALNEYQVERVLDAIRTHDQGIGPIGILGLAYKPETSVIERSQALAVIARLVADGRDVIAFDPKALGAAHEALGGSFAAAASAEECVRDASIVVLMTPWPEFRAVPAEAFARSPRMTVIDCWRLLSHQEVSAFADIVYLGLGATHAAPTTA
jgi:UDPglucose 6-dehydrogenase